MTVELGAWSPGLQSCISFPGVVSESLRALQPALGGWECPQVVQTEQENRMIKH